MTDEELDAIEARCNAATPGPWACRFANKPDNTGGIDCGILDGHEKIIAETFENVGNGNVCGFDKRPAGDNGHFIAASRTDVPALIAEVRRLLAIEQAAKEAMVIIEAKPFAAIDYLRNALYPPQQDAANNPLFNGADAPEGK